SQQQAAEGPGVRAWQPCQPQEARPSARAQLIQKTCRYMEANLGEKLTLEMLSGQAGLSPFHFQRTFKRILGISRRQYAEARRLEKVKRCPTNAESRTIARHNAGSAS